MNHRFRFSRSQLGLLLSVGFLLLAIWIVLCIGRVDFAAQLILTAFLLTLIYTVLTFLQRTRRWTKFLCILYEICLSLGIAVVLSCTIFLNVTAARTATAADSADVPYVIVFGAAVHGETPSLILWNRTRTAYQYLEAHPTSKAILSGGMGDRESITEAEAMRRLLTQWGIAESRLILETKAANTRENARFSAEWMDSPETTAVLAVSNAFHLHRCIRMLQEAGFSTIDTLSAPLPSVGTAVSMYLRETVATVYYFFFD